MKLLKWIFLVILAGALTLNADAQRKKEKNKNTPESAAKADAEKQASAQQEKQNQYKSRRDHHLEVQDKATRKRMKKTKKKAERHSWGKDVPWYKRWFRKDKF
jgi:hypothetical protein